MIVDISLDCVVSQRPLWGTLVRLPRPLSLMFPYSRRVMIVLRRPCSVFFLTDVCWAFSFHCRQQFDRISLGSKHFVGSVFWPNCLSQCCVRRVPLTVPKHLDSCSTFHKAVVTSRAFPSHIVSWLWAGSFPGPYTQCAIGVPSEKAAVCWRCFPGPSALLPMRRALCPRKSGPFSFMLLTHER